MKTPACRADAIGRAAFAVVAAALAVTGQIAPVSAHDMDLQLRWLPDGAMEGRLVYSDDAPAAGNFIQVSVADDPTFSPLALQTGEQGTFRVALQPWRRYTVTAEGDEGHRLTVQTGRAERPLQEGETDDSSWPPVYLILAALLLLSLPLSRRLRA